MSRLYKISLFAMVVVLIILSVLCYYFRFSIIGIIVALIFYIPSLFNSTPAPDITYGEFPVYVQYELNGELTTIEDIVVCEFDGFVVEGMNEKKRRWKSYLKSGYEELYLLNTEDTDIYLWHGSPDYYMDDLVYQTRDEYEAELKEKIDLTVEMLSGEEKTFKVISPEEAETDYNIKIIEVKFSEPITNSFEDKWLLKEIKS